MNKGGTKSLDILKKRVVVDVKDKDSYGHIVGVVYYKSMNLNLYMIEVENAR